MDNRLVFTVLFVTLSWMSMSTYAQNTTQTPNNMTTTGHTMTTEEHTGTTAGHTMTTAGHTGTTTGHTMTTAGHAGTTAGHTGTTAGHTMTTAGHAGTTAGHNMTTTGHTGTTTGHNMTTTGHAGTTTGHNMTTTGHAGTTTGHNMTTTGHAGTTTGHAGTTTGHAGTTAGHNMTTAGHNMTTAGHNMTTAQPFLTTAVPPLVPNTTVEALTVPISRAGCGTEQLCAAEPSDCNPAVAGSCFFFAAKAQGGQNFEFSLSGESTGYVATTLSSDSTVGNNDTTYVCANNNSAVNFFSTLLDAGQLTVVQLPVNSVKGNVNGNKIQCTFAATVPPPVTRTSQFSISISTGTFNPSSGRLGSPARRFESSVVDLRNPNSSVTNQLSATTAPPTTSHAVTFQQSLMQALLITVGVLRLAML